MSDYDSSLPIKTHGDPEEKVHSKLVDWTDPDGTDKQLEISEKKAHVRVHAKDSDGNDKQVLLSQEGHVQSNGDYDATNNKRPSSQGLITSDRSASPSESTMNKRPTSIAGNDDKVAMDVAISDSSGNRIDENNPLAVYQAESPADEIDDYDNAVDVAGGGTANHDYTVTALKSLKSIQVKCSASGKAKFSLQIEDAPLAGTFTEVATGFVSASDNNHTLEYKKKVAAGVIVRVVKENRESNPAKPQDLYSQIQGLEI